MADLIRFGRRIPLPSSVQILHDLLALGRKEQSSKPLGGAEIAAKPAREPEALSKALPVPPERV